MKFKSRKKMTASEVKIDEKKKQDTHLKKLNINKNAETGERNINMNIKVGENIKNILVRLENKRGDNKDAKMPRMPNEEVASHKRRENED